MRRVIAMFVAAGVLVACAGSNGDDAASEPDTVPTTLGEQPTSTVDDGLVTLAALAGDSAFDQLAAFEATEGVEEIHVALAELSRYIGPIPGVPTLLDDDSIYPSLTHVLDEIEAGRSGLTPEQVAAVDAGVAALFPADDMTDEFPLFADTAGDGDGDGDGDGGGSAEPEGFARQGFASAEPPTPDASPEVRAAVLAAAEAVRSYLGGPVLNIWVQTFPLGAHGDVAGRNLGLDPADERRDSLPGRPDCLIQLATGTTAGDIAGIVAHEITHCWQFTRIGFDVSRWDATGKWVREGQAAFVGHELGGLTRYNGNWWSHYLGGSVDADGQWPMYTRSYDAIGFWARVDAGSDVVAAMRRTLDVSPSDSRMFTAATTDIADGRSWIGAGTFQRSDWGAGWTASGVGDPGTPRRSTSHTVIERNDVALSADAGAQANHEIDVSPVGGADGSVVTAQGRGTGVMHVDPHDIVLSGSQVEEWCIGECACPDGAPAFPADRIMSDAFTIHASLVGGPSEATTLGVRVGEFDAEDPDRCEEPEEDPEPAPEPDGDSGGLIGTWRANPNAVAQAFEAASSFGAAEAAIDVAGATGDVLLTFDEGGTGTLTYDAVTLFLNNEVLGDLTLNGAGTFNWSPSGGSIAITGTDYAISVTSSALGGELLTLTDEDVPASGSTTLSGTVAGNRLTFASVDGSAGAVFFPTSWTRAD